MAVVSPPGVCFSASVRFQRNFSHGQIYWSLCEISLASLGCHPERKLKQLVLQGRELARKLHFEIYGRSVLTGLAGDGGMEGEVTGRGGGGPWSPEFPISDPQLYNSQLLVWNLQQ